MFKNLVQRNKAVNPSPQDLQVGTAGNDVFYVNASNEVVQDSSSLDRDVAYASVNWVMTAGSHIEVLSAISSSATTPLELSGNEFSQEIYGNAGANFIDGGGGADYLAGFAGNDIYIVRHGNDYIAEGPGGGRDVVYSFVDYTLTSGQEIEVLSTISQAATTPLQLIGNGFRQEMYGNEGANFIDGGVGDEDYMQGFGGNDTYIVDHGSDYIAENPGGGRDVVYAKTSYTLTPGAEVEVLSVISQGAGVVIDLTGNELVNELYGNTEANFLDGGGGADYMRGFSGNDSYVVETQGDVVDEGAGEGSHDVVYARASYTLAAGVSIEVLSAQSQSSTNAIDLTGNELAQEIYGNSGANVLNGGAGADYLVGYGGADTFAFTTTLGGGNVDQIADFQAGVDKIQLSGAAGQPFAALASGTLRAGAFVVGAAALDADDYIIYNSANGALLFDADGNGGNAAVQFATLGTGLSLTAADFVVAGPANNAPAITSATTASVVENSPAGNVVYQASATDADGDRFTWSLGGTDAASFTIDAVTGAVRLVTAADFETKTSYNFTVIASDSGTPAGTGSVTLSVIDVNDTPSTPIINETSSPNDNVASAQVIDRNVLTVNANSDLSDQSLPSATIHGSVSSNNDVDYFSITLQAGEKLILDIDHSSGGLDSYLRIYGPNGAELGSNDDLVSFDPGSVSTIAPHNTDSFISFRAPSAGTYYFSVEAFGDLNNDGDDDGPTVGESNGGYSLNVSIGPPATMAQLISEDIDALISGSRWPGTSLTYGFPTLASQYPANIKETDSSNDNFAPFSAQQQSVVTTLLGMISQVSSLTFTQNIANPGATHLRWAMSDEAEVAYAYYPPASGNPGGLGGSAWFNVSEGHFNNPVLGNYAWMGILHETGHALGLKHGHEAPAIQADRDSVEYSVMTYRSYPGQALTGGYRNETWGYPQSPMMYDIAALQRIYGANFATNNTNTVYSFSPTSGEMSINGAPQGVPGNNDPNANRVFRTIWDGGGNDTYDMSNYGTNLTIDLRPGEWSKLGGQLAGLGDGHFARGNIASALQFEGNPASLIENAIGGSGTDSLVANQAANQLTGNGGVDTFKWMAGSDAGTGAFADTILDFVRGTDKIDLSGVDAISGTSPDDAFTFIGTGAFTNSAGQLRYEVTGGHAHIFADLDGNGLADMEIVVNNVTTLAGADFIL
ncbi:MAG: serralysin [Sphingomonadales bacterium]|nr:serralysin [Sphingomonadales bacterium]